MFVGVSVIFNFPYDAFLRKLKRVGPFYLFLSGNNPYKNLTLNGLFLMRKRR